jgi:hypothetical protein
MAQQTINIGSAYKDPDSDKSRDAFDKIKDNFDELYAANTSREGEIDAIETQIGDNVKVVVAIGTWNMDANELKLVNWTLPASNMIRSISVIIHADTGSSAYPLNYTEDLAAPVISGSFYYTGTQFSLSRLDASMFDSASYDSTSVNRGYIVVEYDVTTPV